MSAPQSEPVETPHGLLMPDGRLLNPHVIESGGGFERIDGLMNRTEWRQLQAVLQSQYFIFRNDGGDYGERMICKSRNPDGSWRGCGRVHMYISSHCVEMPFRGGDGLEQGLWLTFRAAHSDVHKRSILQAISKLSDLSTGHPLSARDLAPPEPGENWLGVLISLPEPITKVKAVEFATRINDQRPPVSFCLHEPCRDFMTPSPQCSLGMHTIGVEA